MASGSMANKSVVLVGDDNPIIRKMVGLNLKIRNFTVYEAENGQQVVEFLTHTVPNLIILDLAMPVMSGVEVCEWIQKRRLDVPILVFTAYGDAETKTRVLEAGATEYMTKPLNVEQLVTRVRALVQGAAPGS